MVCLISQSIVLGYLTEYFGINEPTSEETRNAYLYAAGKLAVFSIKVPISFQAPPPLPYHNIFNKHYKLIIIT